MAHRWPTSGPQDFMVDLGYLDIEYWLVRPAVVLLCHVSEISGLIIFWSTVQICDALPFIFYVRLSALSDSGALFFLRPSKTWVSWINDLATNLVAVGGFDPRQALH